MSYFRFRNKHFSFFPTEKCHFLFQSVSTAGMTKELIVKNNVLLLFFEEVIFNHGFWLLFIFTASKLFLSCHYL